MNIKSMAVATAIAGLAASLQAAVGVSNVSVQQRWPWNGLVDITYTVTSDNQNDRLFVYPEAFDKDRNIAIAPMTLTGDGANGASVTPGTHKITWNMAADDPTLHSSALSVTMHAFKGAPYLKLDLSGGPNAESYPVTYSDTPPDTSDVLCRTSNMWFRICLPGTFMMGSPTDEPGRDSYNETLHKVTISKPFYLAIFETTITQYRQVMGGTVSKEFDCPVNGVRYDTIRGSVTGNAYPKHNQTDPDSFMGLLRAKTGILFDLPTEAQWEYACRAGTSTALYSGKPLTDENLAEIARYNGNREDGKGGKSYMSYTSVGQYKPNAWGFYDMLGNVPEWCLDWYVQNLGSNAVTDPTGPSTGFRRVARGGYFWNPKENCRSATRHETISGVLTNYLGFRVACIPVVK